MEDIEWENEKLKVNEFNLNDDTEIAADMDLDPEIAADLDLDPEIAAIVQNVSRNLDNPENERVDVVGETQTPWFGYPNATVGPWDPEVFPSTSPLIPEPVGDFKLTKTLYGPRLEWKPPKNINHEPVCYYASIVLGRSFGPKRKKTLYLLHKGSANYVYISHRAMRLAFIEDPTRPSAHFHIMVRTSDGYGLTCLARWVYAPGDIPERLFKQLKKWNLRNQFRRRL